MKKQIFFSTLFVFTLFSALKAMQLEDVDPAKRYVIGVDLHDTYLSRDFAGFSKKIASIVVHAPNKFSLFRLAPWIAARGWALSKLPQYQGAGHDIMDKLAEEFPPVAPIKDQILDAIDGQLHKPNPEMIEIMRELKAKGFSTVIVSNISPRGLQGLKDKNPDAFNNFDAEFISDQPRKVTISGEEIMVPRKPSLDYYRILREKLLNPNERFKDKTMVFVDDHQDYIDGAHQADVNIEGIVYKNPQLYRHALANKGFLPYKDTVKPVSTNFQTFWHYIRSKFI